jgi:hypothetical protein
VRQLLHDTPEKEKKIISSSGLYSSGTPHDPVIGISRSSGLVKILIRSNEG